MLDLVGTDKTAGLGNLITRFSKSPGFRQAILRSTALGAGTGALGGALAAKDPQQSRIEQILRSALLGGVGGAVSGAAFPGWFDRKSMLAHDE
jgi:uncharacterized membrane protein YoaK (UPF0700 family)